MELQLDLKPKGYSVFLGRGDFSHLSRFTDLNGKILVLTDDGVRRNTSGRLWNSVQMPR